MSELLRTLQETRLDDRITIGSLSTDGNRATGGLTPTPIGHTRLMAAVVSVKGSYADYDGLEHYLAGIRALPVSVTSLKVDGSTFELSIRAYGTAE